MSSGNGVRVSVVVALYNTGAHLRKLMASLDAQTMPRTDFEVILVDDGSTDDTAARARKLAATRPNVVVETIPNSGWPGRPRNVGTDLARGEYVFFSDHDDRFGPTALAALYAYATANGSDIVYGKVVRIGRATTHWPVWHDDIPVADPAGVAVASRTVHKLYRREFLREHGIRFREGRIRMEDYDFTAQALPRAKVISILASVPCYWWVHRNDGTNTSSTRSDPNVYWAHFAHSLQTWTATAGPGPVLDAAVLSTLDQAYFRIAPDRYLPRTDANRAKIFAAVHPVFRTYLRPELDHRMSVLRRLRSQALRAGDRPRFEALQRHRDELVFELSTDAIARSDRRLRLVVSAVCRSAESAGPLALEQRGPRTLLPLPRELPADDDDRALLDSDLGRLEVTIRHRESGVEWPIHTQSSVRPTGLQVRTEADVDLVRDTFGALLAPGIWDLFGRIEFLGEAAVRRVPPPAGGLPAGSGRGPGALYVTANGLLSFRVGPRRPRELIRWIARRTRLRAAAARLGSWHYH